jgi:hypothetical protein
LEPTVFDAITPIKWKHLNGQLSRQKMMHWDAQCATGSSRLASSILIHSESSEKKKLVITEKNRLGGGLFADTSGVVARRKNMHFGPGNE